MRKIFISYRRDDTEEVVERLSDALAVSCPDFSVFRDIGGIKVSEDWVRKLRDEIIATHVVLVVIGPKWLDSRAGGQRRIDDSQDILRREIVWALEQHKLIAPVLTGDTEMPAANELPAALQFLHRCQAHRLHDKTFDADVVRLGQQLRQLLEEAERRQERERARADSLLDGIDASVGDGPLKFSPGAVYIQDFPLAGKWHCTVQSPIPNEPGFGPAGRTIIDFEIPVSGGTFEGTWDAGSRYRIEGRYMIGTNYPDDPGRVTSMRLEGVSEGVNRFAWEIPIGELAGEGYRGSDAQGRDYYLVHTPAVVPPAPDF